MNWFAGVVVYVLIWWVALFAVLPIGTRPDAAGDLAAGGWRGAPVQARIGRKMLWTTVLATALWLVAYALITSNTLSFRSGPLALPGN
jgi:predicted secreted protein